MTILLVRHGETEWNLERRYQGRFNSPLTELGVAQARAIGRLLSGLPEPVAAAIVASPQGRARRTAEIIREELGSAGAVSLDERLRELTLGSWDGLTYGDVARRSPGIFDGDGRYEWYFRSPDGESYEAFVARVGGWLGEQDGAAPIIVVAHGLVSRVLRGLFAGLPRTVALTLPVPQDRIYRLSNGAIEELRAQRDPADEDGRRVDFVDHVVELVFAEPRHVRDLGRYGWAAEVVEDGAEPLFTRHRRLHVANQKA